MLTLLSPAKSLDFDAPEIAVSATRPQLDKDVKALIRRCKDLDVATLRRLMKLSPQLGELNYERFQEMRWPFTEKNAKPCVLAFRGDVYKGLDADTLSKRDLNWAQNRLRILSGLYGVLRPLDLIQPYRLEMGTRLDNDRGKDLYAFWGDRITAALNGEGRRHKAVLNLASNEYFKAVPTAGLKPRLVTADFQEYRDGKLKTIGFYAKRARGLLARYVIDERVDDPDGLKDFAQEGYSFDPAGSTSDRLLFTRERDWKAA